MAAPAGVKVFKAMYKFGAAESDELDLNVGDFIEVSVEHPGEWGFGTHQRTKKQGSFPWSYVKRVQDARPASASKPRDDAVTLNPAYGGGRPSASSQAASSPRSAPRGQGQAQSAGGQPPPVMRTKKPKEAAAAASYENFPAGGFGVPSPATSGGPAGKEPFAKEPWFAGPMDRPEAERAMAGKKDGTFLIRKSKNHDGYSLSVLYSECRHIKICKINGRYGLVEENLFGTVPELVKEFLTVSLQCYNAELETVLEFPYKTAPDAPAGYRDDEPDEAIYMSNKSELIQSYAKKTGAAKTVADSSHYTIEVKRLQKDQRAQEQVLTFYREQKTLLEGKGKDVATDNLGKLKRRLVDAERNLQQIAAKLKHKIEEEDRGLGSQEVQATTEPVYSPYSSVRMRSLSEIPPVPEASKSQFYCGEITREKAEELLKKQKDGTYLVRKSQRATDPYTLSIRFMNQSRHIQIKYDGTRFGLASPLAFYSLEGLCEYYKATELSPSIKCRLVKPLKDKTTR